LLFVAHLFIVTNLLEKHLHFIQKDINTIEEKNDLVGHKKTSVYQDYWLLVEDKLFLWYEYFSSKL